MLVMIVPCALPAPRSEFCRRLTLFRIHQPSQLITHVPYLVAPIAHRMLDAPLPRVCPLTNGDLVGPDLLTACRTRCHFSLILLNQPIPQGECRQGHVPLFADLLEDD
jgi:hypothetical protein